MERRDVIELICRLRSSRDKCGTASPFERGMRAGFHLAAQRLWDAWKLSQ